MGEKEPFEDATFTHTICRECSIKFLDVDPLKVKEETKMDNPTKRPSRAKFCPERLASPKKFDHRSFRTTTARAHRLTFGCPKGKYSAKKGVCKVPVELQRILHPAGEGKCPIPGAKIGKNPRVTSMQRAMNYWESISVGSRKKFLDEWGYEEFLATKDWDELPYEVKTDVKYMIEKKYGINPTHKACPVHKNPHKGCPACKLNPGEEWHAKRSAEEFDISFGLSKQKGAKKHSHIAYGKSLAHGESAREARKLGMKNPPAVREWLVIDKRTGNLISSHNTYKAANKKARQSSWYIIKNKIELESMSYGVPERFKKNPPLPAKIYSKAIELFAKGWGSDSVKIELKHLYGISDAKAAAVVRRAASVVHGKRKLITPDEHKAILKILG